MLLKKPEMVLIEGDGLVCNPGERVEGYTNDEIASKLGCTRRTVQRRLNLIRDLWQRDADERA